MFFYELLIVRDHHLDESLDAAEATRRVREVLSGVHGLEHVTIGGTANRLELGAFIASVPPLGALAIISQIRRTLTDACPHISGWRLVPDDQLG